MVSLWKKSITIFIISTVGIGIFLSYGVFEQAIWEYLVRSPRKPSSSLPLDIAEFSIDLLPKRKADAFKEYLRSLGLNAFKKKTNGSLNPEKINVQGSNPGLQSRNNTLMKNSCFASLAQRLYSIADAEALDSLARGERKERQIITNEKPESRLYNVFKLDEFVGSPDFKRVSPGWFWKQALVIANGDTTLAAQLVGICTHDDWGGAYADDVEDVNDQNLNRRKIRALEKIASDDPKILYRSNPENSPQQSLNKKMDDLQKRTKGASILRTIFSCDAQTSNGYRLYLLPGSIGEQFDIESSLKEKIAKLQSPSLGQKGVRSKYYHVYGAFQSACILVRGGYPDFMVKQIAQRVARAYRANGICPDINSYSKMFSVLKEKNLLDRDKIIKILSSEETRKNFLRLFPDSKVLEFNSIKDNAKFAGIILSYSYAGQVLKNGLNLDLINCDKFQILGRVGPLIQAMSNSGDPYSSWCNSAGVKDKRNCHEAMKVIKTWAVDFEWTERQHELGAVAATEMCKYDKGDEDIFKSACSAWEKIRKDFTSKEVAPNPSDKVFSTTRTK